MMDGKSSGQGSRQGYTKRARVKKKEKKEND
jgi:hypothetical protein